MTAITAITCDRCGARAMTLCELTSGGALAFCAHHSREHVDKLREGGAVIHDLTTTTKAPATA